jgi:hypothetical protein
MNNHNKFFKALFILKPNVEATLSTENNEITETDFNNVKWNTGEDNGTAITTTTNPHSEITWTKVKAEMDRLQAEYDAQEYARKREAEYPSVQDLVVALYDTDDKAAIDSKRAEIKLKYPKPGA